MSLSGQRIDDDTLYDQTGPVQLSSRFGGRAVTDGEAR